MPEKEQVRRHEKYSGQVRDVYDQSASKKTKRQTEASHWYVKWGPLLGFVGVYVVLWLVCLLMHPVISDILSLLFGKKLQLTTIQLTGLLWGKLSSTWALLVFVCACGAAFFMWWILKKRYETNNQDLDASDINTYEGDSEIQQPEDLPQKYDIAPDAGAHYDVEVTAVLSHMDFSNQGLKKVKVTQRYDKTENGHLKGEAKYDENGELITKTEPMMDPKFQQALFDASSVPDVKAGDGKSVREIYDPRKINYNPKLNIRGKAQDKTVADLINDTWTFPDYELQRPAGAYIVDTSPSNTMVLAMTRAGKGQTIIEPTIDLWTRSNTPTNFLCNDPKGELYRKFYYPASRRGFEVLCFNLINDSRTNIFNPLDYAVEAARKGNYGKVSEYVKKIGSVFFPEVKGADPMWNNAANNTFIRSAIGLIDYYYEEEREMREIANQSHWSAQKLDRELDKLWGHVTLYNVYQMMVQLAGKKSSDPEVIGLTEDEMQQSDDEEEPEEKDYLTLFFDATDKLPRNSIRDDVMNAHNAVNAMAGSDKTIASVYGIALTALSFFTDPKISRLTSGRPSQNFDMVGLAFPRRIEVRFDQDYMKKYSLRDNRYKWTAYHDVEMTKPYKNCEYENVVGADGWVQYAFKPIFQENVTYLKLEIVEANTNQLMKEFKFKFTKGYQQSLSGRTFIKDPVSHQRIVKDGTLEEIVSEKIRDGSGKPKYDADGHAIYRETLGHTEIEKSFIDISRKSSVKDNSDLRGIQYSEAMSGNTTSPTNLKKVMKVPAIAQIEVHYTERPKAIFVVTPPHMMEYAKLILIMIDQMFNMQVDSAYMTLPSQKPFYGTKYMLDEVGNLQSGGSGIPGLQTKESIGLGQSQQYTLILQTLQQLKDVYGDSIDKILEGNTSNLVYLKSTDDSMLSTLEQLSGITHEAHIDSKSVTKDTKAVMNNTDSKTTHTISIKEKPVITKNDMLHIPTCNDMVFAADNPIWSTNQTALPMAWRLHKNLVHDPAQPSYALSDVPSTSNTNDFDRLQNQPDFFRMVDKRVKQARLAPDMTRRYRILHGLDLHGSHENNLVVSDPDVDSKLDGIELSDDELSRIDHNQLANDIMDGINRTIRFQNKKALADAKGDADDEAEIEEMQEDLTGIPAIDYDENSMVEKANGIVSSRKAENNADFQTSKAESEKQYADENKKEFFNNRLSKKDVLNNNTYRNEFVQAFQNCRDAFNNDPELMLDSSNNLRLKNSGVILLKNNSSSLDKGLNKDDSNTNYASNDDQTNGYDEALTYTYEDAFGDYLIQHHDWSQIAGGQWLEELEKVNSDYENDN